MIGRASRSILNKFARDRNMSSELHDAGVKTNPNCNEISWRDNGFCARAATVERWRPIQNR